MALTNVVVGNQIVVANVNQLIDLLTGVMTDQPVYVQNTIRAGAAGATAFAAFAGGTASGAPVAGAHVIGEFAVDQTGFIWICTVAGTPGTWKLAGAPLATTTPPALTAAGAVGTLASAAREDHIHPWTGLGVLANAQSWAALQTFMAGIIVQGTASGGGFTDEMKFGTTAANALLGLTDYATGAPVLYFDHRGTGNTGTFAWRNGTVGATQLMSLGGTGILTVLTSISAPVFNATQGPCSVGYNGQARRLMTASTRYDADATEGDILFNV